MTTIWDWPAGVELETQTFRLKAYNSSSLVSGTRELVRGGVLTQRFEAKLARSSLDEALWRDQDGLFAALRGTDGFIRLWDQARPEPFFNQTVQGSGTPWAGGATWSNGQLWTAGKLPPFVVSAELGERGVNYLRMQGFPAALSGVLRRGDLFEIRPNGIPADHGHLYVVTRWANSDANGWTGVEFEPGLRKGVAAGDMIVLGGSGSAPTSVFRFNSDDEGDIEVRAPNFGSFGATFIEVLPHR